MLSLRLRPRLRPQAQATGSGHRLKFKLRLRLRLWFRLRFFYTGKTLEPELALFSAYAPSLFRDPMISTTKCHLAPFYI